MRFLVIIAAIASVVGNGATWSVFPPKYDYMYEYTAQVLSGIPTIGEQYSGVAYQCKVHIRAYEGLFVVTFKKVEVAELNSDLDTVDIEEVPFKFDPLPDELMKYFSYPINVKTENGKITEINLNEEVPEYIINIVKAFLSHLDMSLPAPGTAFTSLPPTAIRTTASSSPAYRSGSRYPPASITNFTQYDIENEEEIEGNCPARYIVSSDPWEGNPEAPAVNVTVIKNFDDCDDEDFVDWLMLTHTPDKCVNCEEDDTDFLNTMKVTLYDMLEDPTAKHYIIEKVESRSETLFMPLTADNDQLSTNSSAIIRLISKTPFDFTTPPVFGNKNIHTLQYRFPKLKQVDEIKYEDLYTRPVSHVVERVPCPKQDIYRLTEEVATIIKNRKTGNEEALEKTAFLAHAYSTCSYEEISAISKVYFPGRKAPTDSMEQVKWRIFRDTSMMKGSLPVLTFFIGKIEARDIDGEEANQIIMAIPLYIRKPAAVFTEQLMKLCKSQTSQSSKQMWTTCFLAVGSLIDMSCGPENTTKPERPYLTTYCTEEQGRDFVLNIGHILSRVQEEWKKAVLIQTLGLITHESVIDVLRPYINNEKYLPERLRALAIYAVSDSVYESSEKIVPLMAEIIANSNETYIIRIAALTVVARAKRNSHFLANYAGYTWQEDDEQVVNFMTSMLEELSNSTHPCTKEDSAHATYADSIAEDVDVGIFDSQMKIFSNYIEEMGLGSMFKFAWINNNQSMLPRTFYFEANRTIGPYSQQPLELALHMQGFNTIFERLLAFDSIAFPDRTYWDILKGNVKDTPQGPGDIWEKLKLLPRSKDDLKLSLWTKFLNHVNRMFNIEAQDITEGYEYAKNVIRSVSPEAWRNGIPFSYQKIGYLADAVYVFPSSVGIPIHAKVAVNGIIDVQGKISVKREPDNAPIMNVKSVEVQVDIAPSIAIRVIARLGVYNPITLNYSASAVYAGGHIKLPFISNTKIDIKSMKLEHSVKASPILQGVKEVQLSHYEVIPYTTLRPYNEFRSYSDYAQPILTKERMDEYKYELDSKALGFPVKFLTKSDLYWQDQASLKEYYDSHDITSYLLFWWLTPDFNYQEYNIITEPSTFCAAEFSVSLEMENLKNRYTDLLWKGQNLYEGLYALFMGWGKPVWKCSNDQAPEFLSKYPTEDDYYRKPEYEYQRNPSSDYKPDPYYKYPGEESQASRASVIYEVPLQGSDAVFGKQFILVASVKGPVDRSMTVTLKYSRDYSQLVDNATIDVIVTNPISFTTVSPLPRLQLCVDAAIQYPLLPCSYKALLRPETVQPITARANLKWGETCRSAVSYINFNGKFSKSEAQIEDEKEADDWYMEQCAEDRANKRIISEACEEAVEQLTSLNRAEFELSYNYLSPWILNASRQFQELVIAANYWQMSRNSYDVHNAPNKISGITEFHPTDPIIDMYFYKPTENIFFRSVYYPQYSDYIMPINPRVSWWRRVADDITEGYAPPTCKVMPKSIETFDNTTYDVELGPCQYVLVKDCTESDLFTILVSQPGTGPEKKFAVYLPHKKIEITPLKPHSGQFQLKIVDKIITMKPNVAYMVEATDPKYNNKILAVVTVTGEHLTLKAPRHGIIFRTDGVNAKVMVANIWQGRVCGLCDEFTGDSTDDFTGPKQCVYEHAKDFVREYAVYGECKSKEWAPKICPENENPTYPSIKRSSLFSEPKYEEYPKYHGYTDAPKRGSYFGNYEPTTPDYDFTTPDYDFTTPDDDDTTPDYDYQKGANRYGRRL